MLNELFDLKHLATYYQINIIFIEEGFNEAAEGKKTKHVKQ